MGVFTMPSLGADMESGRIVEWLIKPGDRVHRGDVVAVVDTTKAAIEVEVFEDGTVAELLVEPGTEVEVGTALATITADADGPDSTSKSDPDTELAGDQIGGPVDDSESQNHSVPENGQELPWQMHPITLRATPPVRHLAHQLGVDLDSLAGSAPGGKITRGDVQAAAPATHEPDCANRHVERQAPDSVTLPGSAPGSEHAPPSADPAEPSESDSEKGRSVGGSPEPSASASRDRLRATPRARRLAAQQGIELRSVTGTGAGGTITGPDVETAARSHPSAASTDDLDAGKETTGTSDEASPEPVDTEGTVAGTVSDTAKLASGISATHEDRKARRRSATAALMARSAREIPHYYVSETVDVTHALDWLKSHNVDLPVRKRVLPAVLFLRATVLAAQKVEDLNGHWVDDTFVPGDGVQLGVAVAMRDGGLLTPVIIDAHLVSLDELMARLADLVRRARSGRLRSREIEPGTITVSSLADRGPDALFGVIYPPQVALVGVGSVAARPWVVDGKLAARTTANLTVAADHRATDGRIGADFLSALSSALTRPEEM